MTPFVAELLGTALVVTIGDGVVANNILPNTKGNNGGLITIVLGWVIAVFIGVYATGSISGGHLNPAVTIAFAAAGKFSWALVPSYILAQLLGAMLGALIVWMIYKDQFNESKDQAAQLGVFSTGPSIRNLPQNFMVETLATLVFLLGIFLLKPASSDLGALSALPRIMHFVLPIKGKGSSDWGYAAVPVLGPIVGGILAAIIYVQFLQ